MNGNKGKQVTRRAFLSLGGVSLAAISLAACGATPTATPTAKPVPPTATTAPAAPAATATTAPVATATKAPVVPTAQPTAAAKKGGVLIFGDKGEPNNLDIHVQGSSIVDEWGMYPYATLLYRGESGKYVPYLAKSWQTSPDGLTWTFSLRNDVVFHDGTPLNAKAVVRSFQRIVDPKTVSQNAATLIGASRLKTIEAPDDYTVKLVFNSPFAVLLDGLVRAYCGIISPAALDKFGADIGFNPVGAGPFKLKEWVVKKQISFVPFDKFNWMPSYFEIQGPPPLEEYRIVPILEDATRVAAFERGEVHIIRLPLSEFKRIKAAGFNVMQIDVPGVPVSVFMNVSRAPLDDLKVRQAIAYAVDRDAMVNAPFTGGATWLEDTPLTKGMWSYDPGLAKRAGLPYDVKKAAALLDEAGWKLGSDGVRAKGGTRMELVMIADWAGIVPQSEALQSMLQQVGIKSTIKSLEGAAATEALVAGNQHHIHMNSSSATDPDALYGFHSPAAGQPFTAKFSSYTHVTDAKLDKLLEDGRTEVDIVKRAPIYIQAQEILLSQAYIVPIYNVCRVFASQTFVKGVKFIDRSINVAFAATAVK